MLFLTHTRYILPVENTPYRKLRNTRCTTPLQFILEGLHSRQSVLVRLTNQFEAFFNPKNAPETKATNKYQMFKANINNSRQELLYCCFCDHVSPNINKLWLLLCYLRVRVQLASYPGCHFNTHPKGNLVLYIVQRMSKH